MYKKKILVVAPYPIKKPLHGGQKRAMAIFEQYKQNFAAAKYVAVYHRGQYADHGSDDILLGDPKLIAMIDENPNASELVAGEAIDKDIHVRSFFAKLLMEFKPDIIHLEQPYPYIGLSVLLSELNMSPRIVYGSQNIEYLMKRRIFKELKVPEKTWKQLIQKTKELELKLSKVADLIITVNKEDTEAHYKMGAKKCVIAPNGIEKTKPTKAAVKRWQEFKRKKGIKHLITFVGSGHPPNWMGFLAMVGDDSSFLPKDSRLLIAGGVSEFFAQKYKEKASKFWSRAEATGRLEEDDLAAVLAVTDVILLPITTERGSNLKTAEAILTRKKFVATDFAFHGFENFRDLPNVFVANSQKDFKNEILRALKSDYVAPSPDSLALSEKVQWSYCLQPMVKAVSRLRSKRSLRITVRRVKRKILALKP